jgi:hypothetical protein
MVGVMIDTGHGGSGVVGVRLVSSDVPRGWLQPCATSELSVVGACRALDQASRAHEKKIQTASRDARARVRVVGICVLGP